MDLNENNSVEKDALTGDKLISGHEYDNIRELDNNLPRWWVGLFIITILFAVVYVFRYHILHSAPLQEREYKNEMTAAAAKYKNLAVAAVTIDTANLVLVKDDAGLKAGADIFAKNCVVCHGPQGQGVVGPNLTDEFWIHGCRYNEILYTIINGVIDKGMIAWKTQISPEQIEQVASYIMTLKGTNPPNPKPPQGVKCE